MRCCDRVKFACAAASLSLISGGHQDRIIHSRAKLDRTDYDWCHKRQLCSSVKRNTHIHKDRKFDHTDQDHRNSNWFEQKQNNHKYDSNRHCTYTLKVRVCNVDQIFCQWSFSYQHCTLIIFIHDLINLLNLFVYFIRCYFVRRIYHQQLVLVIFQHTGDRFREHICRDTWTDQIIQSKYPFNTIYFFNLLWHLLDIRTCNRAVHQDHMCGVHIVIFF